MTHAVPQGIISREEYHRWYDDQPGRYERIDGRVYAMSPERVEHVRAKAQVWLALHRAIERAGVRCEAFNDGMTVETDDSDYEPDASVNCGTPIEAGSTSLTDPVIVVEVLSPSTRMIDSGYKLAGYFTVPSIQHYLIIHPTRRSVIHHRRTGERIDTAIIAAGQIVLDPPGLMLTMDELYPPT